MLYASVRGLEAYEPCVSERWRVNESCLVLCEGAFTFLPSLLVSGGGVGCVTVQSIHKLAAQTAAPPIKPTSSRPLVLVLFFATSLMRRR